METISVVAGNHAVSTERNGFVKIPWISRIGYGLADSSCNIVYGMINTLLTLFYTDYVCISFATVGLSCCCPVFLTAALTLSWALL